NVLDLELRPSCSRDLPVSRGWPGLLQDLRVYHRRGPIVHESCCTPQEQNQGGYSEPCTGDAQDFHRHILWSAWKADAFRRAGLSCEICSRPANLAGRARKFVDSERIVA